MALAQVLASPEAQRLRGGVKASHAGSWRKFPVRRWCGRRSPGLLPACEGFDHDHLAAAARAWGPDVRWLVRFIIVGKRCNLQQSAGQPDALPARATGKQAIVADAVEALRQDVDQEAADELVGTKRHDLLPAGAAAAVILT